MSQMYQVKSKTTGAIIRLYALIGSTYKYALYENGKEIRKYQDLGSAYRDYNMYAR